MRAQPNGLNSGRQVFRFGHPTRRASPSHLRGASGHKFTSSTLLREGRHNSPTQRAQTLSSLCSVPRSDICYSLTPLDLRPFELLDAAISFFLRLSIDRVKARAERFDEHRVPIGSLINRLRSLQPSLCLLHALGVSNKSNFKLKVYISDGLDALDKFMPVSGLDDKETAGPPQVRRCRWRGSSCAIHSVARRPAAGRVERAAPDIRPPILFDRFTRGEPQCLRGVARRVGLVCIARLAWLGCSSVGG